MAAPTRAAPRGCYGSIDPSPAQPVLTSGLNSLGPGPPGFSVRQDGRASARRRERRSQGVGLPCAQGASYQASPPAYKGRRAILGFRVFRSEESFLKSIYSSFLRVSSFTAAFPSLGRPQMESDVYIDTAFHGEGSRLSTLAAQAPAIRVCTTCIVHARARDQAWPKGGEEGRPQQPIRRERGIRL